MAEELRLRGGAPADADAAGVSQGGSRLSSWKRGSAVTFAALVTLARWPRTPD